MCWETLPQNNETAAKLLPKDLTKNYKTVFEHGSVDQLFASAIGNGKLLICSPPINQDILLIKNSSKTCVFYTGLISGKKRN
mgnify:CR=1 FL=1